MKLALLLLLIAFPCYGAVFLNTNTVFDTTPDQFTFIDQTDVDLSTEITSAGIYVEGINAAAAITVTGGTYDINESGTFVSTAGTVNNMDVVRARHTSSDTADTAVNTVVTIGTIEDTFTSTTLAAVASFDCTGTILCTDFEEVGTPTGFNPNAIFDYDYGTAVEETALYDTESLRVAHTSTTDLVVWTESTTTVTEIEFSIKIDTPPADGNHTFAHWKDGASDQGYIIAQSVDNTAGTWILRAQITGSGVVQTGTVNFTDIVDIRLVLTSGESLYTIERFWKLSTDTEWSAGASTSRTVTWGKPDRIQSRTITNLSTIIDNFKVSEGTP